METIWLATILGAPLAAALLLPLLRGQARYPTGHTGAPAAQQGQQQRRCQRRAQDGHQPDGLHLCSFSTPRLPGILRPELEAPG